MKHQKQKRVLITHGYNVSDRGKKSIDALIPSLLSKSIQLKDVDYGHFNLWDVLAHNETVSLVIASFVEPGDVGIGHSNGCTVLLKAAQQGAPFSRLIFINPALKSDIEIPDHIKHVDVLFTKHDLATKFARMLRLMSWTHKNFLWGEMGRTGYTGNDIRVNNIDMSSYSKGHSDVFSLENLGRVVPIIKEKIKHS